MGYPILLVRGEKGGREGEKRERGKQRRGRGRGRGGEGEEEGGGKERGRERRDMGQAMVVPITPKGSLVYCTGCLLHRVSTACTILHRVLTATLASVRTSFLVV